ncbi:MAG: protein kinase [Bacilli bacterium]|nr:protein kinase [Bacilli bacterium]
MPEENKDLYLGQATQVETDATRVETDATLLETGATVVEPTGDEALLGQPEALGIAEEYPAGTVLGDGYEIVRTLVTRTPSGQAQLYGVKKQDKRYVAKVFFPGFMGAERKVREALKKINCPYLMPILADGTTSDGRYYEIAPFYRHGSLEKHRGPSEPMLKTVIEELNEALHALHEADLIHGDVKPQNVYMTDDGRHIVLGDYDIARFLDGRKNIKNDRRMTPKYAAPECTNVPSIIMKESDMFSFGMTLRYISHGSDEYFDVLDTAAIAELRAEGELILPTDIDSDIRDLITVLTRTKAKDRADYAAVASWLKDPAPFRGNATDARFAENNPKIRSFEYKGKHVTTLKDLASLLNSDWNGLEVVLSASAPAPSKERLLVQHLLDSGLQSTAAEVRVILSSHEPLYNRVTRLLHALDPSMGLSAFGTLFPSVKAFFEHIYAHPDFPLMPAMFRYEILTMYAKSEGNDGLVKELDHLKKGFPKCNDEEWADVVLNYFRNADVFYLRLRPMGLKDYLDGLSALVPAPSYLSSRAPYLQAIFMKQGKLSEELCKKVYREAMKENDARFLQRLSFVLLGHAEARVGSKTVHNVAEFVLAQNEAYAKGEKGLEALYEEGGTFFFLLSLEGGNNAALEAAVRKESSIALRPAVVYCMTEKVPLYQGCASIDEFAKKALAQSNTEQAFAKALKDPVFKLWAGRFTNIA